MSADYVINQNKSMRKINVASILNRSAWVFLIIPVVHWRMKRKIQSRTCEWFYKKKYMWPDRGPVSDPDVWSFNHTPGNPRMNAYGKGDDVIVSKVNAADSTKRQHDLTAIISCVWNHLPVDAINNQENRP